MASLRSNSRPEPSIASSGVKQVRPRIALFYGGDGATAPRDKLAAWLGAQANVDVVKAVDLPPSSDQPVDHRVDGLLKNADGAIILYTSDSRSEYGAPNVIDEHGRSTSLLPRSRVLVIRQRVVKIPSNRLGEVYVPFDTDISSAFDKILPFVDELRQELFAEEVLSGPVRLIGALVSVLGILIMVGFLFVVVTLVTTPHRHVDSWVRKITIEMPAVAGDSRCESWRTLNELHGRPFLLNGSRAILLGLSDDSCGDGLLQGVLVDSQSEVCHSISGPPASDFRVPSSPWIVTDEGILGLDPERRKAAYFSVGTRRWQTVPHPPVVIQEWSMNVPGSTGSPWVMVGIVAEDPETQFLTWNRVHQSWRPVSNKSAPAARPRQAIASLGEEFLVWGGYSAGEWLNQGGVYSPRDDAWVPIGGRDGPQGEVGAIATVGEFAYTIGRRASGPVSLFKFSLHSGRWDVVPLRPSIDLTGMAIEQATDESIFLSGGLYLRVPGEHLEQLPQDGGRLGPLRVMLGRAIDKFRPRRLSLSRGRRLPGAILVEEVDIVHPDLPSPMKLLFED